MLCRPRSVWATGSFLLLALFVRSLGETAGAPPAAVNGCGRGEATPGSDRLATEVWRAGFGGAGADEVTALAALPGAPGVVVAVLDRPGIRATRAGRHSRTLLVRLRADGERAWAMSLGHVLVREMALDPAGNLVVVGRPIEEPTRGGIAWRIARADGALLSRESILPGTEFDPSGFAVAPGGRLAIAGTLPRPPGSAAVVVAGNEAGPFRVVRRFGRVGWIYGSSAVVHRGHGAFAVGVFRARSITPDLTRTAVIALDARLRVQWRRPFIPESLLPDEATAVHALSVGASGEIVAAGAVTPLGEVAHEDSRQADTAIRAWGNDGRSAWFVHRRWGHRDEGRAALARDAGSAIVTGRSAGANCDYGRFVVSCIADGRPSLPAKVVAPGKQGVASEVAGLTADSVVVGGTLAPRNSASPYDGDAVVVRLRVDRAGCA